MGIYVYPNNTETEITNAYIGIPFPSSITLNKSSISLTTVGQTEQLTATLSPTPCDQSVTWSSDAPRIATVDQSGLVTCEIPGTARITATTVNGLTATCDVDANEGWTRPSTLKGGYWKLDGNMNDSSGNGHTGSGTANYVADRDGVTDGAYYASGTSYYVSVPNSSELYMMNGESFSLGFWIKPSYSKGATGITGGVISITQNIDRYRGWSIHYDGNGLEWQFRTNNGSLTSSSLSSLTWSSGEWFHFVITYDGSTLSYYKNGTLLDSFSRSVGDCNTTYALTIGYARTWYASGMAVYDDVFYMKDYCLDGTEVASIYSGGIVV